MNELNENDNKVDVSKEYYESGALLSETPYVNDKRHGVEKHYYENGRIKEERLYVDGELKGTINYDEIVK